MSNLLSAANTNPDKFIIGELPVNSGDVSIITVDELYNSLEDNSSFAHAIKMNYESVFDSNSNDPTYYMYCIIDVKRSDPTLDSIKAIGIDWYRQLNKNTITEQVFSVGDKTLCGGPLFTIDHYNNGDYDLGWYCYEGEVGNSRYNYNWRSYVVGSMHVVVVHS